MYFNAGAILTICHDIRSLIPQTASRARNCLQLAPPNPSITARRPSCVLWRLPLGKRKFDISPATSRPVKMYDLCIGGHMGRALGVRAKELAAAKLPCLNSDRSDDGHESWPCMSSVAHYLLYRPSQRPNTAISTLVSPLVSYFPEANL